MNTYAGYVQCDHCRVYDTDPHWCVLCDQPKDIGQARIRRASDREHWRISVLSSNESSPAVNRRMPLRRRVVGTEARKPAGPR